MKPIMLMFIGVVALAGCAAAKPVIAPEYTVAGAHALRWKWMTVNNKFLGCTDVVHLNHIVSISASSDIVAYQKIAQRYIDNDECVFLKQGTKVFVEEATTDGYIKFRREGEVESYWTITLVVLPAL
jgi:hypothetical protein